MKNKVITFITCCLVLSGYFATASPFSFSNENGFNGVNNDGYFLVTPDTTFSDTLIVSVESASLNCQTDSFSISISVENFNDLTSLQFSVQWDTTFLHFLGTSNTNLPDAANFGTSQAAGGTLTFAWFDMLFSGVTLPSGAVIFNLDFVAVQPTFPHTAIQITNNPTPIEATDNAGNIVPVYTTTGYVTIPNSTTLQFTSCPADIYTSSDPGTCAAAVFWIPPGIPDLCGNPATLTSTHNPGDVFPTGATTVTYTATDSFGNTVTCSFQVSVCSSDPVVFDNPPADIIVECASEIPPSTNLGWTNSCGEQGFVSGFDIPSSGLCPGEINRYWYYVNDCADTTFVSQNIIVNDVTMPTMQNPPADLTLECFADLPTMPNLAWTDNCTGSGTVSGQDISNGGTPEIITRFWTYSDYCGNTAAVTQYITMAHTGSSPNDFSIEDGNIIIDSSCNGLIQKSPNGTCFKILISDAGVISAVPVPCP